jgi:hypothetical protein
MGEIPDELRPPAPIAFVETLVSIRMRIGRPVEMNHYSLEVLARDRLATFEEEARGDRLAAAGGTRTSRATRRQRLVSSACLRLGAAWRIVRAAAAGAKPRP